MKPKLDMDKIAKCLRASRRGSVQATGDFLERAVHGPNLDRAPSCSPGPETVTR